MNITIVGGGNIGTQFAVHCAYKRHAVTVFTSKPERFSQTVRCVDAQGNETCCGELSCVTSDPETAFSQAQVIFVTVPADCMAQYARLITPYVRPGVMVGLIPGTGGGECAFRECLDKGAVLFGLQRVPAVARLAEYGRTVCSTGYRPELFAAALPKKHTQDCCRLLSEIFDMPCTPLPDYLNLTLTPSNPILHTTRLRTLFGDFAPGVVYDRIPLFYQQWSDESSRLLFVCDDEVQQLCKKLSMFDLSGVRSLKEHYESKTPEALTQKISHIPAFQGLPSPQKAVDGGYIPDLQSRYFTADFSYGLSILVQVAQLFGSPCPNMEETLQWYRDISGDSRMFRFADWGLDDPATFISFYRQ
ncbi:MAG: NAD/NADP octopine/nopaline dehydrogenase family protein [Oscillospiraceae bacterium]|nr:NAD/NADP octopine/nopaline dehydrogenase family protein [Oscillospiraceae bacterium]